MSSKCLLSPALGKKNKLPTQTPNDFQEQMPTFSIPDSLLITAQLVSFCSKNCIKLCDTKQHEQSSYLYLVAYIFNRYWFDTVIAESKKSQRVITWKNSFKVL